MVGFALAFVLSTQAEAIRLRTTWAQRVDLSDTILRGQVTSVKSYWNAARTMIYTDVTFLVDEYLKGQGPAEKTITLPGGTVGEEKVIVSDVAQFEVGDYGVVAMEPTGHVTGGPDGFHLMMKSLSGGVKTLSPGEDRFLEWIKSYIDGSTTQTYEDLAPDQSTLPAPKAGVITNVNPATISAGTGNSVTITGSGFGASRGGGNFPTIAFRYKDSDYMYDNTKISYWSDTQIVAEVWTGIVNSYNHSPGSWSDTVGFVNSSGSIEDTWPLTVPFGYGRYKWNATSVSYKVNETGSGLASGAPLAAIQAAAATWTNSGANFSFVYGGATASGWGQDGQNVLSFAYLGGGGTIAQATSYISGSYVIESDVQFNTYFSWSTATPVPGGSMDLQTITVHEMGHWLRLLDLYGANDTTKVMYGFASSGLNKRVLTASDISGIVWIYGGGGPGPPPGPTLISPSGTIYTTNPTYSWNASAGATYYLLWVDDAVTNGKIQNWYTPAEAGCPSGTGTCSVTPATPLVGGSAVWAVWAENSVGGNWSADMFFTVASGPDLTGWWNYLYQTCKTTSKGLKCKIRGSLAVHNQGNLLAYPSWVDFYLWDGGSTFFGPLKYVSTGKMKPGKVKNKKLKYTLPLGDHAAGWYVLAWIDSYETVAELNEANNMPYDGPLW
jgi:hypothetical protein